MIIAKDTLSKQDLLSSDQWGDYKFQMKNAIRTKSQLETWVTLSETELRGIEQTESQYKWMITPYYASLMDETNENCPIRLQSIPHPKEVEESNQQEDVDPVGDMVYMKTRRVVHKYPNRVIFLVSDTCPVYCRHCTRKFHTTDKSGTYYNKELPASYDQDIEYIANNKNISDVLLTGGDPLILPDKLLHSIISRLNAIPHVDFVRIGSRYPVFLPQRITDDFCKMLSEFKSIWFSTHFNHPVEVTPEALSAVDKLLSHGIPVQNQTVLLRGVNDDVETLRTLNRMLVKGRVRPYYLYHADNVQGVSHFRTSIEKGLEIMEQLHGYETGFSVPQYVYTTKLGKIPLNNQYFYKLGSKKFVLGYDHKTLEIS